MYALLPGVRDTRLGYLVSGPLPGIGYSNIDSFISSSLDSTTSSSRFLESQLSLSFAAGILVSGIYDAVFPRRLDASAFNSSSEVM